MGKLDIIQNALDDLALALPDGYVWPQRLRQSYEKAVREISKLKAQAKKDPARFPKPGQ